MITTRVLPPEEWTRIQHLEPFASGGLPNPDYWRIVVVERDGQIVGMCSLFETVHWDCFWVDPAERGNAVVFRDVIEGGIQTMRDLGIAMVHTTVKHDGGPEAQMLEKFGFQRTLGALYYYVRQD